VTKKWKILGGGGVHHRPSGMEIPGGWGGVKIERPSVGGISIFSGNTHSASSESVTDFNVQ